MKSLDGLLNFPWWGWGVEEGVRVLGGGCCGRLRLVAVGRCWSLVVVLLLLLLLLPLRQCWDADVRQDVNCILKNTERLLVCVGR